MESSIWSEGIWALSRVQTYASNTLRVAEEVCGLHAGELTRVRSWNALVSHVPHASATDGSAYQYEKLHVGEVVCSRSSVAAVWAWWCGYVPPEV